MGNNGFAQLVGVLALLVAWNFLVISWDDPISNPWFMILPSLAVALSGPLFGLVQRPSWKRGAAYLAVGSLEGLLAYGTVHGLRDGGPGLPAGTLLGAALSAAAVLCGVTLLGRYART